MPCHVGSCLFLFAFFVSFCFPIFNLSRRIQYAVELVDSSVFAKVAPLFRFAVSSLISGRRIVLTEQCLMVLRMLPAILGLANVCPFPIFSSVSDPAAKSKRKHPP